MLAIPKIRPELRLASSAPITHANQIKTSTYFQDYATKLKSMITATTINLSAPIKTNMWKRAHQMPKMINLSDETFPPLDTTKKQ